MECRPACPGGPRRGICLRPAAVPYLPYRGGWTLTSSPERLGKASLWMPGSGRGGGVVQSKHELMTRVAVTTGLVRSRKSGEDVL